MTTNGTAENTQGTNPPAGNTEDTQPVAPKLEVKEGKYFIDGKVFVPEKDLMAVKESSKAELKTITEAHSAAVDKLSLEKSDAIKQVATAQAALKEAQEARNSGEASAEEVSKLKKDLELAKSELTTTTNKMKDLRVKSISTSFGIPADKLATMSDKELDSVETALAALGNNRGPGNYAIGSSSGPINARTEQERAARILESATQVRNPPANKL